MQNSAVKVIADLDKIAENIQSIGEDIKSPELTVEDKSEIRDQLIDLMQKMEQVRDNFRKDSEKSESKKS